MAVLLATDRPPMTISTIPKTLVLYTIWHWVTAQEASTVSRMDEALNTGLVLLLLYTVSWSKIKVTNTIEPLWNYIENTVHHRA